MRNSFQSFHTASKLLHMTTLILKKIAAWRKKTIQECKFIDSKLFPVFMLYAVVFILSHTYRHRTNNVEPNNYINKKHIAYKLIFKLIDSGVWKLTNL